MYLVTGGAGFIGSHVVELLDAHGLPYRIFDNLSTGRVDNIGQDRWRDHGVHGCITNDRSVRRAMEGVEYVIHLAAKCSVPEAETNPELYIRTNVEGTLNVVRAAAEVGVRRVVFASSCSVYGNAGHGIRERDAQIHPAGIYAATKAWCEQLGSIYARRVPFTACRLFNVIGARQDLSTTVLPRFAHAAAHDDPLTIYDDGKQTRDYVPVGVVAQALLNAAHVEVRAFCAANVCSGRATTVTELVDWIEGAVGRTLKRRFLPPRAGDVRHISGDPEYGLALLRYPDVDDDALRQAVADSVRWYISQAA